MRPARCSVVVLMMGVACVASFSCSAPSKNDAGPTDPRCVQDASMYTPRLSLQFTDGGFNADDSYLSTDVVEVRVDGLPPCWPVAFRFESDQGGISVADFVSTFAGTVSTATQAPVFGDWSVVDPDAPVWAMRNDQPGRPDVSVSASVGAAMPLQVRWTRKNQSPGVDSIPIRGYKGVYGDLYVPAGNGKFPGVLVIGDADGNPRFTQQLARSVANEGFLALGVLYFGEENTALPPRLREIPLEYFERAITILEEHEAYQSGALGLTGSGRGAEAALLLASRRSDVKAMVLSNGSPLVWPSLDDPTVSSWTRADAGVPFLAMSSVAPQRRTTDGGVDVTIRRNVFSASVAAASASSLEAAMIPLENIPGALMFVAASDDETWPSCELATLAMQRLREKGRADAGQVICVAGAGHALNPANIGLPMGDADFFLLSDGGAVGWGGTPQATGQGNRSTYHRFVDFLRTQLK